MPCYDNLIYGIIGELGEVIEPIKKSERPGDRAQPYNREKLKLEFGDVYWYLTRLVHEHGFDLDEILKLNIEKLNKRHNGE